MEKAIDHVRKTGVPARRIGVEMAFVPADAEHTLRKEMPDSEIIDALFTLERLRARKTPEELAKLKIASERVIESMMAVIANHGPGTTKQELADALKREEVNRGLTFEYCLDRGRLKPQPRAVGAAMGEGRCALPRFRRQLSRLYRGPRPHGHPGRARRRT